jgi:hypothetical protein
MDCNKERIDDSLGKVQSWMVGDWDGRGRTGTWELRGFDVAVAFFHSHGEIDAAEGGINNSRGKHGDKNVKSM